MQTLESQPTFTLPLGPKTQEQEKNIKAVLFDLFDTLLIIHDEHECYTKSLDKLHKTLLRNGFNCSFTDFNNSYLKSIEQIEAQTANSLEEPHFKTYIQNALSDLGYTVSKKDISVSVATDEFCIEFARHIQVDFHAVKVLKLIQSKYKTALISNLSFSECAWELLTTHNLAVFFDFIVVSGDVNMRKPDPKIFRMALDRLGVSASEAVFVGDNLETDVKGALNCGMIPIHVDRRKTEKTEICCKPYMTVNSLEQVLLILEELEEEIIG